jgi:hypothetical protein
MDTINLASGPIKWKDFVSIYPFFMKLITYPFKVQQATNICIKLGVQEKVMYV